jgi:hypothetical protein
MNTYSIIAYSIKDLNSFINKFKEWQTQLNEIDNAQENED